MKRLRDSLILALTGLTLNSMAALPTLAAAPRKPAKPAAAVTAPAPVPALSADDLMRDAQAAQAKGDHDLALRLAQSAIVAAPSRPAAYTALGDLYAANGDADFARFYYRQALQIDPVDADATRAMAMLDRGDHQQAAKAGTDTP
ncbi:MAG TPA: tetratricopeptide repeat protein [Rhizomicrobium sp.]|jgi:tetratricopeptide (TPR) repeat protein|nr:tetratricopeptide repeat protein [Rhizomicrobium sp.]